MALEGKAAGFALIGFGITGLSVGVPALKERIQSLNIDIDEQPFTALVRLYLEGGNELIATCMGAAAIIAGSIQVAVSRK